MKEYPCMICDSHDIHLRSKTTLNNNVSTGVSTGVAIGTYNTPSKPILISNNYSL